MIKSKQKTKINCTACGKELHVRNDYFKKHKGLCISCCGKQVWSNKDYAEMQSKSHRGKEKKYYKIPYAESNFRGLFYSYRKSAETRGLDFNLTSDQFRLLTKMNCYYCGVEPLQIYDKKCSKYNGYWIHNGIDRLSDDNGYQIDNVVTCCKKCNYAKQGMTDIEFLNHIRKIYEHHLSFNYEIDGLGSRTETAK